ncbi:hypothetical protein C0993_012800 [Termitomyces sp. T159_Od127]|nr:hypothetical protein C0993_012800 [Termitomyces sp. T159_Od127]
MSSTISAKMPWPILLVMTLAWRVMARVSTDIAARQEHFPQLETKFSFVVDNSNYTSCAPATFNWTYEGPDRSFSFFLTRVDMDQDTTTSASSSPSVRSLHRRDDSTVRIASSKSPFDEQLNLPSLPVQPGRYFLVAKTTSIPPPYTTHSSVFTVQQGTNLSCLLSLQLSSSTPTLSSSATSSDLASITPTDETSSTVVPVGGVSSTSVNKGAIAGGIIAGVVAIFAVVVFYFLFVVRPRRSRAHSRAPGDPHSHAPVKGNFGISTSGGKDGGGRWGGLGSVDSHLPPSETKVQRTYGNTGRQSNGAGVSQDDIDSYFSRSGSVNYGGYIGSPSEEKFSSSSPPSDEMVLSVLPYRSDPKVPTPNNNRRSSASPFEYRHSQSQAWRSSLDSSSTHGPSPSSSPIVPSPASLTCTSLPSTQNTPRKTARKPVPAYYETSDDLTMSSAPPSLPALATTPFADPVLPHPAPAYSGHYTTRSERASLKSLSSNSKSKSKLRKDRSDTSSTNASREEILAQQDLAHKNSFGPGGLEGKQLHYLIPDMPVGH